MPGAIDPDELSDQALFNRISDHYAKKDIVRSTKLARRAIVRRAIRPLLDQVGSLGTVVDIGCGIGAQMEYLGETFDRYIGIDYSEKLIDIGRRRFAERADVEFIAANIKEAPLPDKLADTVIAVGALHHMKDLGDVMAALHRLAKPGARFIAIEPQRGNPVIQAMRHVRMKLDRTYSTDQHFFSSDELYRVLELAPMTDTSIEFQGFLTPPFGQAGVRPQWVFLPLSVIACAAEPIVDRLLFGPLRRLSWNAVAYGRFE
jgi:ubiquinone/menaquinone biosynthesis C-methylase UbiE